MTSFRAAYFRLIEHRTSTAVSARLASGTLGLIAETRIGGDVDFLVKLALGVTIGRATTILSCSAS
jgi:hypothetical protein